MNYRHFPAVAIFALAALSARGDQTYGGGDIGDVTWTAGEVITFTATTQIVGNVVAEAGVSVRLNADVLIYVGGGTLTANGTAESPVSFGPASGDAPAYWGRIQSGPNSTISLNHTTITHARQAIYAEYTAVSLSHCTITDIAGAAGVDGGPGADGGNGGSVTALLFGSGATAAITDTVIDGVRAGKGGKGGDGEPGSPNPNGGVGGYGGAALGIGHYNQDPINLIFERNVIGNIVSGAGGDGGAGISGGNGGDGGGAGSSHAMDIINLANATTLRNCVFHHILVGPPGAGGLAEPGGSVFDGNPGFPGSVSGLFGIGSSLLIRHFTFDSLGDPTANTAAAVEVYPGTASGFRILENCTLTNIRAQTAYGQRFAAPAWIDSDTCNFFNTPEIINNGDVVDPVSLDPGFVSAGTGDYHLSAGSPLINIGNYAFTPVDLDGEARDGAPDIGADEYVATYVGRDFGDFDDSHCTDINDFLYLLDNWQTVVGGSEIGINDFLALLDNWMSGSACM